MQSESMAAWRSGQIFYLPWNAASWKLPRGACPPSPPSCRHWAEPMNSSSDTVVVVVMYWHVVVVVSYIHCVPKKTEATKLWAVTLSNLNRFSKFFHWQTQLEICYAVLCSHSTTPNVCRYTTLWNMNYREINEIRHIPKKTSWCIFVIASPNAN